MLHPPLNKPMNDLGLEIDQVLSASSTRYKTSLEVDASPLADALNRVIKSSADNFVVRITESNWSGAAWFPDDVVDGVGLLSTFGKEDCIGPIKLCTHLTMPKNVKVQVVKRLESRFTSFDPCRVT